MSPGEAAPVCTILLIDDDDDMLTILGQLFESNGFRVHKAADGEEALEKMETLRPNLVITDLMIPKINGWQLCRKMKETPALKNIPILVITGKTTDIDQLMSFESGADEYISKPFENHELVACAKRLTEKNPPA